MTYGPILQLVTRPGDDIEAKRKALEESKQRHPSNGKGKR